MACKDVDFHLQRNTGNNYLGDMCIARSLKAVRERARTSKEVFKFIDCPLVCRLSQDFGCESKASHAPCRVPLDREEDEVGRLLPVVENAMRQFARKKQGRRHEPCAVMGRHRSDAYQTGEGLGSLLVDAATHPDRVTPRPGRAVLPADLDCSTLQQKISTGVRQPPLVNLFAAAVGDAYEDYLPLYAFFALSTNVGAVVEMVVSDVPAYLQRNSRGLGWLSGHFGDRLCVRRYAGAAPDENWVPNSRRFLEKPTVIADYTYIGDVDIFIFEPVVEPLRLYQMQRHGLPYSDVLRNNSVAHQARLTGLILVETKPYFTPALLAAQRQFIRDFKTHGRKNDETMLRDLACGGAAQL